MRSLIAELKRRNVFDMGGGCAPIQVNLTECVLSDIAENAVSFPYQRVVQA